MQGQVLQSQTPIWELSLLQRGHQDQHTVPGGPGRGPPPMPPLPRQPWSQCSALRERPICIGGIRGSPRKRMAQALIKSTSNNKPPEQCAGSERAVRWQEPRGSSRRGRAKRELCPRRGCKRAGGEGLARARAAGTFPESWQGAEGLLGGLGMKWSLHALGGGFRRSSGALVGHPGQGAQPPGRGFAKKKPKNLLGPALAAEWAWGRSCPASSCLS